MKIRFLKSLFLLCFLSFAVSAQTSNAEKPAETYKIKAGDKLSVRFLNHPELNEPSIAVRPDGFISLQLIEDIKAEGATAVELRKKIEKGYDEILLNPAISVNIIEFVPPSFFIGGQVNRPGKYSLRDGNSVIKAVFLAGGFTKEANRRMVLYARVDQNGKWQVREINVLKLIEKLSSGDDVAISDGDYIFVPDSKLSKFNKALEGFQSFFPIIPLL
ncbi:MAG TPA: polysaccharide biosynthesis/export family protein [Pyrinomonadaceae bacterium]|nr:polysaccharide biosynthesis/export family protein [Pyrinomonadaceae bacterium]